MTKIRKTSLPLEIVTIDEGGGIHLCAEITLNRKKCKMVLDTGASRTVFDQDEIKRYVKEDITEIAGKMSAGLGTDSMQTHSVLVKKMKLKSLEITDYEGLALDLTVLNNSYEQLGYKKVIGVLGSDILQEYEAVIDFGKKKLTLRYKD